MKKLFFLLILSLLSAQSFARSCPDGSEPEKSFSTDASYYEFKCSSDSKNNSEGFNSLHTLLRQESSIIRFGTQANINMVTLGPKDGGYPKYPPYDGKNSLNIQMPLMTSVLAPLDLEFIGYKNRNAVMRDQMRPFDDLELCFKSINDKDINLVMCIYHLHSSPLLPDLFKNNKCDVRPDWNIGDKNVAKAGLIYYSYNTNKYP